MKKQLIIFSILLLTSLSYGQTIERQVFGNAGIPVSNSTNSLNFTIGEAIIGTLSSSDSEIKQGFWNTSVLLTLSTDDFSNSSIDIRLFPNPVTNAINIDFSDVASSNYLIEIFDVTGRKQLKELESLVEKLINEKEKPH